MKLKLNKHLISCFYKSLHWIRNFTRSSCISRICEISQFWQARGVVCCGFFLGGGGGMEGVGGEVYSSRTELTGRCEWSQILKSKTYSSDKNYSLVFNLFSLSGFWLAERPLRHLLILCSCAFLFPVLLLYHFCK